MKIKLGNVSVSLNEEKIRNTKKETWIKDVMKTHGKFGDKETLEQIFSDAYDSVKKEKKAK